MRVIEFVRAHWRIPAGIALLAVAFIAGRTTAPVQTRNVVEWRERIEYRDRLLEKTVAGPVRIRTVTHEVPGPAGPERIIERVVERGPVVVERSHEASGVSDVSRASVVETRVEVRPDWRAGVLVGANLGALSLASPAGAVEVGAHVERRVLGPLSLGAFALVPVAHPLAPVVGVSLSAEW